MSNNTFYLLAAAIAALLFCAIWNAQELKRAKEANNRLLQNFAESQHANQELQQHVQALAHENNNLKRYLNHR